jgi:dCMP deaminase
MHRPIDVFRIYMAQRYAELYSDDLHTQIGAIAYKDGYILGHGANVYVGDRPIPFDHLQRPLKYEYITHAEVDLLKDVDLRGATVYVTACPCVDCAAALVDAGVSRVVYGKSDDPALSARWAESWAKAEALFVKNDVAVVSVVVA